MSSIEKQMIAEHQRNVWSAAKAEEYEKRMAEMRANMANMANGWFGEATAKREGGAISMPSLPQLAQGTTAKEAARPLDKETKCDQIKDVMGVMATCFGELKPDGWGAQRYSEFADRYVNGLIGEYRPRDVYPTVEKAIEATLSNIAGIESFNGMGGKNPEGFLWVKSPVVKETHTGVFYTEMRVLWV